jgi:hypothetical protein
METMLPDPFRTARDIAYLSLGLLTSIVAMAVWIVALSLSLTLAILIVGLPVIIGSAYVMRWTAELDRRTAALVFGRPVRGHSRSHRARSLGGRVLATVRDPQTWRDLAWLITHSVVGLVFGIVAVTLVATVAGLATLPLWYWSLPEGAEMGLYNADTLPWAIVTAFLAAPLAWVSVWIIRGLAKFHASLAAELLGRRVTQLTR